MIITLYSTILIIFLFNVYSFADASTSWQIRFQDPATPYMEGILNFHNIIIFFIVIFISWLLCRCLTLYNKKFYTFNLIRNYLDHFSSSNTNDNCNSIFCFILSSMTLKVIENQWYWSYFIFNQLR